MEICEIEGSVNTGLEYCAKDEVFEKFGVESTMEMGRINFKLPVNEIKQILTLSSCDNLSVMMKTYESFTFHQDNELNEKNLEDIVENLDWKTAIKVWQSFTDYKNTISCQPTPSDSELRYRARCYRSGPNHSFGSQDAAKWFGAAVQDYFGWTVDLSHYDLEILLTIQEEKMRLGISLTKESLHRRNIANFGPTTLRPTIAYCMLRMCDIQQGDIVCDGMCGGCSIGIEAALNWPRAGLHLAADMHDLAVQRAKDNVDSVDAKAEVKRRSRLNIDIMQWDMTNLCLRDSLVDVFVTDLPFGKRSGSKSDNKVLYPMCLREMARCASSGARCCLLTHDKRNMIKSLNKVSHLWQRIKYVSTNMGGLPAGIFLLRKKDIQKKNT